MYAWLRFDACLDSWFDAERLIFEFDVFILIISYPHFQSSSYSSRVEVNKPRKSMTQSPDPFPKKLCSLGLLDSIEMSLDLSSTNTNMSTNGTTQGVEGCGGLLWCLGAVKTLRRCHGWFRSDLPQEGVSLFE